MYYGQQKFFSVKVTVDMNRQRFLLWDSQERPKDYTQCIENDIVKVLYVKVLLNHASNWQIQLNC